MDIYAQNASGPLGKWTIFRKKFGNLRYGDWRCRYELTFDRYIPMFKFKERVYHACVNEMNGCIDRIDEMTPKEKALLLTAIYIFERRYRSYPDIVNRMNDNPALEKITNSKEYIREGEVIASLPDDSISDEVYNRWFIIVENYKDAPSISFPAIDTPLEEMKREWEISLEKCDQVMMSRWNISVTERKRYFMYGLEYLALLGSLRIKSPEEARLLSMYGEYYTIFFGGRLMGTGPYCGNSSEFPKTLGEIATQILMSRYP